MGPEPLPPDVPERIGRYAIQRVIGRGMMGVVYQAQDTLLRRTVALKTISLAFSVSRQERDAFELRFLEEARAAAALAHPGIVVVYDFGSDAESRLLYMALEYLRGKTLEAILAEGQPLAWRETVKTAFQVAQALHHAHAQGVIHRDVKPANIMVLGSGEPKIMDFGVAKVGAGHLTTRGQVLGSPSYMSPEQAQGEAVDARADVFALGAVLYELLTGKKAFPGTDLASILMRLANEEPARATGLAAGLPEAVDLVLAHALARRRAERYPSARAFAEDLEDLLNDRPPRHATARSEARPAAAPAMRPAPRVGEGTVRAGEPGAALSLPSGKRLSLAVLDGAERGAVFVVDRPRLLIGRSGGAAAHVELADPEASRTHAALECYGPRVVLRDLGSTNGTFCGERRVGAAELEDRSEFRIGNTRLMLIVADAE
jgi:predicted Ser/Thr protein kinase